MNRKFWLCGLLTAALLVCGCDKDGKDEPVEQEQARTEQEMVPIEQQETQLEGNIVEAEKKLVKLETSMGNIVIELNEEAAPVTVKNFLEYVESGHYNGTVFHRVIKDFMIQGGGFSENMMRKDTLAPIKNEASNGLKNDRGTIAMARTDDPDSATAQFFINHKNNDFLNYVPNVNPGYAVFGKTVEGMDVVDAIASVKTTTKMGMKDVPVESVVIKSAMVVSE